MADVQLQKIKGLYFELQGLLGEIPSLTKAVYFSRTTAQQYNAIVDELEGLTSTDYDRCRLTHADIYNGHSDVYSNAIGRPKIASLIKRLESDYNFSSTNQPSNTSSPVVVTVNQNQQLSVTVTPIQQLINSTDNEEIQKELTELKNALETAHDTQVASGILNSIQQKSWEIFIKVLPYVLEHLGHLSR